MNHDEIHTIRRRLRLTQQELADRVGVARNTISRWECGTMGIKQSAVLLLERIAAEHSAKENSNGRD
jgi:DNA-binding transcriptional regulator YiaG